VDDFEQVLAFWALINDLVERIFAGAAIDAPEHGAIPGCGIGIPQWKHHGFIL